MSEKGVRTKDQGGDSTLGREDWAVFVKSFEKLPTYTQRRAALALGKPPETDKRTAGSATWRLPQVGNGHFLRGHGSRCSWQGLTHCFVSTRVRCTEEGLGEALLTQQ